MTKKIKSERLVHLKIKESIANRLKRQMVVGETYSDVLERLVP